jgi:sec-independent protein translocase protein TatA
MTDPTAIALFGTLGLTEILIIVGIIILLFGATRLPQIGKGLGEGIREFRRSLKGAGDDKDGSRIEEGKDRKGDS